MNPEKRRPSSAAEMRAASWTRESLTHVGLRISLFLNGIVRKRVSWPSFAAPPRVVQWHTSSMPDNDDIKERMKQALEAKKGKAAKSTPHGQAPAEGKVHDQVDRAGGKREFRRKSGG